jgi:hypothetical protein
MQPRKRERIPRIPKLRRADVSRDEFNKVIDLLNERANLLKEHEAWIERLRRDLEIQLKRIAELQFDLDQLKKAGA